MGERMVGKGGWCSLFHHFLLSRPETIVGWYYSHPGFGYWLSSVDISTQQSFEQLTPGAVAFVIEHIQAVKGKIVIDSLLEINPESQVLGLEHHQTISHLCHLYKPSIQALVHGLNRHYCSIFINYRKKNPVLYKTVSANTQMLNDFKLLTKENQESLENTASLQYEGSLCLES